MKTYAIELIDIDLLRPNPVNARTHPKKQIEQVADSIRAFGFLTSLVADKNNQLIAGHCRWLAAKTLHLPQVPVIRAEHLTDTQAKAYALADNKIALNAGWDDDLLRVQLKDLLDAKLDFSVDVTGFSIPETDFIVHDSDPIELPVPAIPGPRVVVAQPGDIWLAGRHLVMCGDCRDMDPIRRALGCTPRVSAVLTDHPYNVKVAGHVSGLGAHRHREFAMASGEMSEAEFLKFLVDSTASMKDTCRPGALLYLCIDWRHLLDMLTAVRMLKLDLVNVCVWNKTNAGMGSMYRSKHEHIVVAKVPGAPHTNHVELGRHGRYRTNVWNYAGMNAFGNGRDETLTWHPTVKPIAMFRDAMLDASDPGDWVLDGFLGSGTTLLAAEQCGRRCLGIELDPAYVDLALTRWRDLTGETPRHKELNMTWEEIRVRRAHGAEARA